MPYEEDRQSAEIVRHYAGDDCSAAETDQVGDQILLDGVG